MGDLLSSKTNSQATTNNQIAQNAGGQAISGTGKGAAVAQGNNNIALAGGIRLSSKDGNNTLNFIQTDQGAVAAGTTVALAAINANSNASINAQNAALATSIHALEVVQDTQGHAADLIAQVQAGANDVALRATPVSAGEIAQTITATFKPVLIAIAVAAGIYGIYRFSKSK